VLSLQAGGVGCYFRLFHMFSSCAFPSFFVVTIGFQPFWIITVNMGSERQAYITFVDCLISSFLFFETTLIQKQKKKKLPKLHENIHTKAIHDLYENQYILCTHATYCTWIMFIVLLSHIWLCLWAGFWVFQDDFCEVVLSGMNVVNVTLQEESYRSLSSHLFLFTEEKV